jgi:hypothetical protein
LVNAMKPTLMLCLGVLWLTMAGCTRALSHDEAKRVIEQNHLIRTTDNVSVDGVSAANATEAVVRAAIGGQTTNLKFRRFDKGWAWEFVETKTGGWVAPDVAIGQIREEHRAIAAVAWADQDRDAYKATVSTLHILMIYVPNPTMGLDVPTWLARRHEIARVVTARLQDRIPVMTNDHVPDAWGSEFLVNFDASNNVALIVSTGPDKTKGTGDDIACIGKFRRDVEDGRPVWAKDVSWILPEGLGGLVEEYTDKPYGKIEYTKAVKP